MTIEATHSDCARHAECVNLGQQFPRWHRCLAKISNYVIANEHT